MVSRSVIGILASLCLFACGDSDDGESPGSPGGIGGSGAAAGTGGGSSGSGGSSTGGSSGSGSGGGATGGSGGSATHVWPGTETRFYPGIYPLIRTLDHQLIQDEYDDWFAGEEDDYREHVGTTPVTFLGLGVLVDAGVFFSEHWKTSTSAPYDWKDVCSRIDDAADPDAAPGGENLYDWTWFDTLLDLPFVQNGGKVVLRVMETYSSGGKLPEWMLAEGYSTPGTDGGWSYSQMQDAAVVYMWQDIMTAFAKRYAGDDRFAAIVFDETFPSLWEHQTLCGNFRELSDDAQAANAGLMEIGKVILDEDPGALWTIVNWFAADDDPLTTWQNGYALGDGTHTPGADDLPGVQGHWRQDIKFFSAEGSGDACSVDATQSKYMNFYLAQHAAIHHTGPVFAGSEANGWTVNASTGHRNGAANPWGVSSWPEWDPAGSLPNDDGDMFPSARFWLWYTSGAPRAAEASERDSGLGQDGEDPCGVVPANFYMPSTPNYTPANRPAWTSDNLSIAQYKKAFDTFGPKGTKAMFNPPPGYLEQFQ
jgi:hypothetical protein